MRSEEEEEEEGGVCVRVGGGRVCWSSILVLTRETSFFEVPFFSCFENCEGSAKSGRENTGCHGESQGWQE